MSFGTISLALLVAHFIGDALLQSDWMALRKSKDNKALAAHAFVYAVCFIPFWGLAFGLITFFAHLLTDFITSRGTSKLWFFKPHETTWINKGGGFDQVILTWTQTGGSRHWFFVLILFDQLLHFVQLSLTASFLGV